MSMVFGSPRNLSAEGSALRIIKIELIDLMLNYTKI